MVSSCFIPSFLRYSSNSAEVNSPPLSVRRVFTLLPRDFSASVFHYSEYITLITYTHTHQVLSSVSMTKYSAPPSDLVLSLPQTSLWINSRGSDVILSLWWELTPFMLPFQAWLTKRNLLCKTIIKIFHKFIFSQLFQVIHSKVTISKMPKVFFCLINNLYQYAHNSSVDHKLHGTGFPL